MTAAPPEGRRAHEDSLLTSLRSVLTPLRELAANATPLPWHQGGPTGSSPNGHRHLVIADARDIDNDPSLVAQCESEHHHEAFADDAALIVALTDALPALLKLADEPAETEPQARPSVAAPEALRGALRMASGETPSDVTDVRQREVK